MKTIYSTGAFGEPYRIEVSDILLNEVRLAQRQLRMLPWNGEMFLPVEVVPLNIKKLSHVSLFKVSQYKAEIVVGKSLVSICIEGPEGRESLLNSSDDLLTVPDVYVSTDFENSLSENVFSLTQHDIDLIDTWKAVEREKLEKISEKT